MVKRMYKGIEIEVIKLDDDPQYRKMQAIGYAIARFQKELGK